MIADGNEPVFGVDYGITCSKGHKNNFDEVRHQSFPSIYSERKCRKCGERWTVDIPMTDEEQKAYLKEFNKHYKSKGKKKKPLKLKITELKAPERKGIF